MKEGRLYAQNAWVAIHGYQEMPWEVLVGFWLQYNLLLASLIERIPRDNFLRPPARLVDALRFNWVLSSKITFFTRSTTWTICWGGQ